MQTPQPPQTTPTTPNVPNVPGVHVAMIAEQDATGRVAELYDRIKAVTGLPFVPDMFRLVSTRPELLEALAAGFAGVFGGGPLPRRVKELIASWASKVNGCPYCVGTHNWFLQEFGGSRELAEAITVADEPSQLPVEPRERVLLEFVTKVARAAYTVTDADWEHTAEAGWSNDEVLDAISVTALFAFVNRFVDATGLGASVPSSRISRLPVSGA